MPCRLGWPLHRDTVAGCTGAAGIAGVAGMAGVAGDEGGDGAGGGVWAAPRCLRGDCHPTAAPPPRLAPPLERTLSLRFALLTPPARGPLLPVLPAHRLMGPVCRHLPHCHSYTWWNCQPPVPSVFQETLHQLNVLFA